MVASAQSGPVLEEITVTARKREESVLEIPESVTNFSASELDRANIRSLKDIGLSVPNLFMSTRMDGFPNVSIRGMGGFGNTQGVGFYLDDVQLFSDQSSRFGDLERVEVLKGPQGVLYGGSNIGGAVKFVSVRPSSDAVEGQLKASLGEFGFRDIEGQVNLPLGESWAMRVFAFDESSDGFLTNPNSVRANGLRNNNDPDVGAVDRHGARIAVAGNVGDRLTAYLTARYNELDGPNNTWIRELDGNFEYPDTVDTSFNPRHERETVAFTGELNYDFDAVTVTFIGSYTDTSSERESDLDLSQDWVLDLIRPEEFEAVTAEFRLSSSTDDAFQWQLGAFHLNLDRDLRSVLNIRGGFCFLDPGFCDPPPPEDDDVIQAVAPFEVSDRRRRQNALFASGTYRFEDWEVSAGLRIDDWQSDRNNLDSGLSG
ncbi:MAG: TonB-dependent receptor, partial [Pseudomonadota bacterium]